MYIRAYHLPQEKLRFLTLGKRLFNRKVRTLDLTDPENETHHLGLGLHHFVVGRRSIGLLHVAIAVGGARRHIDRALLSAVPLAPARTLGNLCPFVFRNHPLKLRLCWQNTRSRSPLSTASQLESIGC